MMENNLESVVEPEVTADIVSPETAPENVTVDEPAKKRKPKRNKGKKELVVDTVTTSSDNDERNGATEQTNVVATGKGDQAAPKKRKIPYAWIAVAALGSLNLGGCWYYDKDKENVSELAASKVAIEKDVLGQKTFFQYQVELYNTLKDKDCIYYSANRQEVIDIMRAQFQKFRNALPRDINRWTESERSIYSLAGTQLINYVNSDESGRDFFFRLKNDVDAHKLVTAYAQKGMQR